MTMNAVLAQESNDLDFIPVRLSQIHGPKSKIVRVGGLAAEVDILGHRDLGVAYMVGARIAPPDARHGASI
ncbi:MAG: hypothetical protein ACRDJ2_12840 [Actinomycetota bacterium]